MSTERQLMVRSRANRLVVSAAKIWLTPKGFRSVGGSSECVFELREADRFGAVVVRTLNHKLAVGLEVFGSLGFFSAERVFRHFSTNPLCGDSSEPKAAYGLDLNYVQLTRDPYKSCIVWQYTDEEPAVLEQLKDVVMNFILATMEPIKTPDDLIDFQLLKVGETDRFAIGVPGGPDAALRLLTLVRLYRPGIYADVRPRVQGALDWYQPVSDQVKRHLAYIDQPGQLPPLPDRSVWAGM